MRAGAEVRVCLTDGAQGFVTPALFEALTGQPCLVEVFEEPERGRMAHIDWARQADLVVVAPATANVINALAAGLATDMLTTLALAHEGPLLIAPAMNPSMYGHESVQHSLDILLQRGAVVVEPMEGDVACGESGQGKLAAIPDLVAAARSLFKRTQVLAGQTVLITSGPTQEPIDGVRYLSNRSSGKMGAALARAALMLGAEVRVVSGPVQVSYHPRARVTGVMTAEQMLAAARAEAQGATWIVGAAAVADYRPAEALDGKRRRDDSGWSLDLVPNPDILATLAQEFPMAKKVGFAAEPTDDLAHAEAKIVRKGLDAIAFNNVSRPRLGFGSDRNALTLIRPGLDPLSSGERTKLECAFWLFETLSTHAS